MIVSVPFQLDWSPDMTASHGAHSFAAMTYTYPGEGRGEGGEGSGERGEGRGERREGRGERGEGRGGKYAIEKTSIIIIIRPLITLYSPIPIPFLSSASQFIYMHRLHIHVHTLTPVVKGLTRFTNNNYTIMFQVEYIVYIYLHVSTAT